MSLSLSASVQWAKLEQTVIMEKKLLKFEAEEITSMLEYECSFRRPPKIEPRGPGKYCVVDNGKKKRAECFKRG